MMLRVLMCTSLLTALLFTALCPSTGHARSEQEIVYYGFDPDIVTNYVTSGRRSLGYIRVTIDLMVDDRKFLSDIEHHEPLILNTIIRIFNQQHEDKIKSLTGREEIRQTILQDLQQILERETGQQMVRDILFTKYLYQ